MRTLTVAIIGAGPYGLSVLERLRANAEILAPGRRITVHVIDPYLGVGGRVWRNDQHERLWMNTTAGIMSLFPDETVRCRGPVRPGPTLQEWASTRGRALSVDEALGDSVEAHSPRRWASRSVMGDYLRWFLDELDAGSGPSFAIHRHAMPAIDVTRADGERGGAELVWLAGRAEPLACDAVVLAIGMVAGAPSASQLRLASLAERAGGGYVPPGLASLEAAERFKPGEHVLIRGLGLTFFDYLQLMTVARGGGFRRAAGGALTYEPSGLEPRIFACSPRGVPYSPAPWPPLSRPRICTVPRFFTVDVFAETLARHDRADAVACIQDLIMSDVELSYYAELFDSHAGRTAIPWESFAAEFTARPLDRERRRRLLARAIPDPDDRFDPLRLEAPLRDAGSDDPEQFQQWMRAYLARLANHSLGREFTAHRAARSSLIRALALVHEARKDPRFAGREPELNRVRIWVAARVRWMEGGPPWPRIEELIALSRAGIVQFLGAGVTLGQEVEPGGLSCAGRHVPPGTRITGVVDARNPELSVRGSDDPLCRNLWARGELAEAVVTVSQGSALMTYSLLKVSARRNLVAADGRPSATRYAVGTSTSHPMTLYGFPRAQANSDVFHVTDGVARSILSGGRADE